MTTSKKRSFFGLNRMMGISILAHFTKSISKSCKQILKPQRSTSGETFAEACARLELTEADIDKRKKEFFIIFNVFAIFALAVFIYSVYLLWQRHVHGGIIGLAATALVLTQVFRYHFWYMQMKKRKLNCSLKDWFQS